MVGEMTSHQSFPHGNPEDCSQQVRTEFLLIRDQGPVDSGGSDIGSVLSQLDMSQPLHYPAIQNGQVTAMTRLSSLYLMMMSLSLISDIMVTDMSSSVIFNDWDQIS